MGNEGDSTELWKPAVCTEEKMPAVLPIVGFDHRLIGVAKYHGSQGYSLHFGPDDHDSYALLREHRKIELIPRGSAWPTAIQVTLLDQSID